MNLIRNLIACCNFAALQQTLARKTRAVLEIYDFCTDQVGPTTPRATFSGTQLTYDKTTCDNER